MGEVFSVKSVPCSEPHSEEIYATVTLPDGDFPGEEVAGRQTSRALRSLRASSDCPTRNRLYLSYLTPSEENLAGDREVLCTVYDPARRHDRTLFDANR